MKLKVLAVVLDDFPFLVGHSPHSMGVTLESMTTSLAVLSLLSHLDSPINPNVPNVKSKEE